MNCYVYYLPNEIVQSHCTSNNFSGSNGRQPFGVGHILAGQKHMFAVFIWWSTGSVTPTSTTAPLNPLLPPLLSPSYLSLATATAISVGRQSPYLCSWSLACMQLLAFYTIFCSLFFFLGSFQVYAVAKLLTIDRPCGSGSGNGSGRGRGSASASGPVDQWRRTRFLQS